MSIIEKILDKFDKDNQAPPKETEKNDLRSISEEKFVSEKNLPDESNIKTEPYIYPDMDGDAKTSKSVIMDLNRLNELGFLTPSTKNHIMLEQLRNIKMQVLPMAFPEMGAGKRNSNIVMVTSSISGEGKTYTSLNLALSIAYEYNHTVLFIDADVVKSTASKLLGIEGHAGLSDYLRNDDPDLSEYILATNIKKFCCIPSGEYHDKTTELYASKKMNNLLSELSSRYNDRLIIIDSPPLLQDTSATALVMSSDIILLIVEAEKTPVHIINDAIRSIKKGKKIAIVLNKSNQRYNASYGYFNYK